MILRFCLCVSVLLCTLFSSCGEDDGYLNLEDGVVYHVRSLGEDNIAPAIGQYISYRLSIKDRVGRKIYATKKRGFDKDEYLRNTHNPEGAIQRNIHLFSEGDSISFIMNPQAFKEQFPFITVPKPSEEYHVEMKITRIEYPEERDNRLMALVNQAKLKESKEIEQYLSQIEDGNEFHLLKGVYLKTISPGDNVVKKGEELKMNYLAYFLDGKKFDSASDQAPLHFEFGSKSQIISGLQTAIELTGYPATAEVIIPSQLAFGDEGSASEIVPPNTPVRYVFQVKKEK